MLRRISFIALLNVVLLNVVMLNVMAILLEPTLKVECHKEL
jgi:hypothetical protein